MEPLTHQLGTRNAERGTISAVSSAFRVPRSEFATCAWHRRQFLQAALGAGLAGFLTPVSQLLAREAEKKKAPAHSIIVLWLGGGPSQLETFDPHPDTNIAGGSLARDTKVKGVRLAHGFEQLADQMDSVALVRSMASKEGDHERGTYTMKTGFRPDATALHPATVANARRMMSSDQIKAFDVMREPAKVREAYGDTPFGRGCLAARRLIEVGVRCVEVSLEGWDSHVDNHKIHARLVGVLDPPFAALLRDLKERKL